MWKSGDMLGRFLLEREVGQGSHGVVFVARDTALDTPVAIKILHPWLAKDKLIYDRFKRELLLARRIAHPGVCRLFDLHDEGDASYITMDWIEGKTLLDILRDEGRLSPSRARAILTGVASALSAAHQAGVIHRDLKPANIIVRAGDQPMILDFGTATAADLSRLTRPGTAVGSMRFIAPEVFAGEAPSVLTDVYSLGVVGYVALAGKLPYPVAANAIEMMDLIRTHQPEPLHQFDANIDEGLSAVIMAAMAKAPSARPASAAAFAEALTDPTKLAPKGENFSTWAHAAVAGDSGASESGDVNSVTNELPPVALSEAAGASSASVSSSHLAIGSSGDGDAETVTEPRLNPMSTALMAPPTAAEAAFAAPSSPLFVRQVAFPERAALHAAHPAQRARSVAVRLGVGAAALILLGVLWMAFAPNAAPEVAVSPPPPTTLVRPKDPASEVKTAEAQPSPPPVDSVEHTDVESFDFGDEALAPSLGRAAKRTGRARTKSALVDGVANVQRVMAQRGFIVGDVPEADAVLRRGKGHEPKADDLERAQAAVLAQQVDRPFVLAKLARFNARYEVAKARHPQLADKVEPLSRGALQALSAGRLDEMNARLNSAFGVLAKN